MARLLEQYRQEIAPELMTVLGLKNALEVPRLAKVVVSMGTTSPMQDKNRLGVVAKDLSLMDVAQGPVVVSFESEALDRARRISLMLTGLRGTCVQKTDVEASGDARRILERKVVEHCCLGKALAVDCNAEVVELGGFGMLLREHFDVVGKCQRLGHPAGRIVVAGNQENGNAGVAEPGHLFDEE